MKRFLSIVAWTLVALVGAGAYGTIAFHRGEHLNSAYLLIAAACTYAIGYRFYSKWIAAHVLVLDDSRATPCEVHEDGRDFVKTNKWIVFGHHFAAISGPGPLVGPVLAAQFGYLPGTLWILIGAVLGGAAQDFVILFCSTRRDGKSLGQMVREEIGPSAGVVALIAILAIMVILLAVLGLVVVKALAQSPWGVATVGATIPIAMAMGGYLRWLRIGKVLEVSVIGAALLLFGVFGGQYVHLHPALAAHFTFSTSELAWIVIGYGFLASVLPVWLLLAPRDYLSTFLKLGTIGALALGVLLVLPELRMPPITQYIDGSGIVLAGKLFPFCFITIACGAISGFHSLIASGVTPKIVAREATIRPVGYGAMCLESLVAIMAMIAATTLDPGVYLAMNVPGAAAAPAAAIQLVNAQGPIYHIEAAQMDRLAQELGEKTLYGRTGGAATLAVGMASILSGATQGRWLDLWYHFVIMFEALFILTTLDAGTRVGRYLLQDGLGHLWKPLGNTGGSMAGIFASLLIVGAWGYFMVQGVRDPLGGINSLWPLFGIANQLLAAVALCLATVVILKMSLRDGSGRSPALCLVPAAPLVVLLVITFTAGLEKIGDPSPRIGFLAAANDNESQAPMLQTKLALARAVGQPAKIDAAAKALHDNRSQHFNNVLDAWVAGMLLILVTLVVSATAQQCLLLLNRRRSVDLREEPAIYLAPEQLRASGSPLSLLGAAAFGLALLKELCGQSAIDRAQQAASVCQCEPGPSRLSRGNVYLSSTKHRYKGIRNCC